MKGKYAVRATNRREVAEVEQSEAAYRRQIVRLTQERDEARRERDESRRAHRQEVRGLLVRVSEGTAPRVEALTRELERLREREGKLNRLLAKRQKDWEVFLSRAKGLVMSERGVTSLEAMEVLCHWGLSPGHQGGNVDKELAIDEYTETEVAKQEVLGRGVTISTGVVRPQDADKVKAVQRARGIRS